MSAGNRNPAESRAEQGANAFVLFAVAWAGYALLHCVVLYFGWFRKSLPEEVAQHAAVMLTAIFVLGKPSSAARLMLLCAAMLFMDFWDAPYWPNHIFHTMVLNLTLMGICLLRLVNRPIGMPLHASIGETFTPIGRLMLIVLYFWVVVHKLNWDYLNPEVSCGWVLYTEVVAFTRGFFGVQLIQQPWMRYPCILGALFAEAAIPLLLIFRRTRAAGLALGLVFHFILAVHHNGYITSFSLMMYAHFTLFLNPAARRACIHWVTTSRFSRALIGGRGLLMPAVLLGALLGYMALIGVIYASLDGVGFASFMRFFHRVTPYAAFFVWLAWAALGFYVFFRFVLRTRPEPIRRGFCVR